MSHKKTDQLDNQNEKFGSLKITLRYLKVKLKNGRRYFQWTYLTKKLVSKLYKDTYSSITCKRMQ